MIVFKADMFAGVGVLICTLPFTMDAGKEPADSGNRCKRRVHFAVALALCGTGFIESP